MKVYVLQIYNSSGFVDGWVLGVYSTWAAALTAQKDYRTNSVTCITEQEVQE